MDMQQQPTHKTPWVMLFFTLMISPVLLSQASTIELPENGWTSWEVEAITDAPQWCCVDWKHDHSRPSVCHLDTGYNRFKHFTRLYPTRSMMKLYTYTQNGRIDRLHTLSSNCPVDTNTTITNRTDISTTTSTHWLKELIASGTTLNNEAIQALTIHDGDEASDELVRIARSSPDIDNRKNAIFWIGQARAHSLGTDLEDIMFNDEKSLIREHAAFSLSQSDSDNVAEKLIELANTDTSERVRGQAWFWLTQTKASQSEAAIYKALDTEKSGKVREQVIFAISQLPDERATAVLTDIVKDRSRSTLERNKAMFWLIHSNADHAIALFDDLLGASS